MIDYFEDTNKKEYIPFESEEVPFGAKLIHGKLRRKGGYRFHSILCVEHTSRIHRVLIMGTDTFYNPKPIWLTNRELFEKYDISFSPEDNWQPIGKSKSETMEFVEL